MQKGNTKQLNMLWELAKLVELVLFFVIWQFSRYKALKRSLKQSWLGIRNNFVKLKIETTYSKNEQ